MMLDKSRPMGRNTASKSKDKQFMTKCLQCPEHYDEITHICLDYNCGKTFCDVCLNYIDDEEHMTLELLQNARIMAIKILQQLEHVFGSELQRLDFIKNTKQKLQKENIGKVEQMLQQNEKVVLNLVSVYFHE